MIKKGVHIVIDQKFMNLIVSALLFSSSADVCATWTEEDQVNMVNISEKIIEVAKVHKKKIDLSFLKILGKTFENPNMVRRIKNLIKLTKG